MGIPMHCEVEETPSVRRPSAAERRRCLRYGVGGNIFVTFRPNFDTVGIVRDISHRGIGFEYTSSSCLGEINATTLDIFLNPLGFKLVGVPYKIAYDADADDECDGPGIRTRRCGIELTGLSRGQFDQLRELILANAASATQTSLAE